MLRVTKWPRYSEVVGTRDEEIILVVTTSFPIVGNILDVSFRALGPFKDMEFLRYSEMDLYIPQTWKLADLLTEIGS